MGIINLDTMTTKSGLNLNDLYLTFTPGIMTMPNPINMVCSVDPSGKKIYHAHATMYIYKSPDSKRDGCEPVEIRQLQIAVDPSAVFNILFDSLKKAFPHYKDVLPSDEQSVDPTQPTSDVAEADEDTAPNSEM